MGICASVQKDETSGEQLSVQPQPEEKCGWNVQNIWVLSTAQKEWRQCTIADVKDESILVHYDGFKPEYDEWIEKQSARIRFSKLACDKIEIRERKQRNWSSVVSGNKQTKRCQDSIVSRNSVPEKANSTPQKTKKNNDLKEKTEVLFFPDPALPCRYYDPYSGSNQCRRRNCEFAHEKTSLIRMLQLLKTSTRTLDVCVYTISLNDISNAMKRLHDNNVRVRIITDDDTIFNPGVDIKDLHEYGIKVKVKVDKDALLHHKFAIIDGNVLMNGSFNWSRHAVLKNQENIVICTFQTLVSTFQTEFDKLWKDFEPLTDKVLRKVSSNRGHRI